MNLIKELRKKTLPESKKNEVKTDIIAFYFFRPISDILTYLFLKLKISATKVTQFSLIWILLSFILFIIGDNKIYYAAALLCIFIWDILDGIDGNIARYTDTCSTKGGLWDATVGWLAMYVFFTGMGLVAFRENSLIKLNFFPNYYYILFGTLAGFSLLFPRLVMHKKAGLEGTSSIKEAKDRYHYGILKKIVFNISSINGLGLIIFIISVSLNITNIVIIMYFILNLGIALGLDYKLLK